ncbi:MAG: UDP-N-acetylmuramoyl-L-alanyl-D-glutamate--2,6-diaminopimelate ligase [Thiotrichales bacterium]|nr:UDP-N-acetylmuramoyl-L-alanyl-D-glutamate--2,6-diaminopimelate ligase [Thiotrichales bacterium]
MMTAKNLDQGMPLSELLDGLVATGGQATVSVTGLCSDSRKVQPGDLFCARAGTRVHGANFISQAVDAGAVAVLMEGCDIPELPRKNIPVMAVDDFSNVLGEVAARFFSRPSEAIPVVGITGTNGKTSITWLLAHAMSDTEHRTGMLGTLGIGFPSSLQESINTTPDAITVHGSIETLKGQGAKRVAMEVSSHALQQCRTAGLHFDQVMFTNLSHEHLDYHETMQAYAAAKRKLFDDYPANFRILNIDDPVGRDWWAEMQDDATVYAVTLSEQDSRTNDHCVYGTLRKNDLQGLILAIGSPWGKAELHSRLFGEFNATNLLLCVTSMCLAGVPLADSIARLGSCPTVPGRLERFGSDATPTVIVDYAHTPDALENVLRTLKQYTRGKLLCVFGCGGDRDRSKRAGMGRVAERYADYILVTNDNPRSEDPETIIREILGGINRTQQLLIEPDRSVAITSAIRQAGCEDVVLIAGKGHESSQLIKGEYLPFSDRNLVRACLEAW